MKAITISKEEETRNFNTRRRNILFLVQKYLLDNCFYNAAEALTTEARLPTSEFEICDNIDLDSMYLDYGSYYQLKFGKFPRILRKTKPKVTFDLPSPKRSTCKVRSAAKAMPPAEARAPDDYSDLKVTVKKLFTGGSGCSAGDQLPSAALKQLMEVEHPRCLQPDLDGILAGGNNMPENSDWQTLLPLVSSTILREDIRCQWSDIFGNHDAIEIIKEAVVTPLKFPQLFAVIGMQPWRSLLLHGPPGSGKTLLAKTLYAETRDLQVTFFNVTSSIVISKWRGDSEKILRVLFNLAQKRAPSIIFLDEIEGLTSRRDRASDHESSKRFKNELLQLLDGIEAQGAASGDNGIFILASTNLPWDIDEAFLRRFEKKLLVQLPNEIERKQLIQRLLPPTLQCSELQVAHFAKISRGFTGDEVRLACKELAMQHIRRMTRSSESFEEMPLEAAFERIRPLGEKLMAKHVEWNRQNGS